MRVFVAGAAGAIGKRLVPRLVAGGYEVVAMTRSSKNSDALRAAGAEPVVADALDRAAVMRAVTEAGPEVVIHELTALTGATNLKRFDDVFAMTNRLRTEGTDNLLAAAHAAGVRRFIAQSYGNWNYARTGPQDRPKTEEDALDPDPPHNQKQSLAAIRHLEDAVLHTEGIEGVALRYGNLYGPATSTSTDGEMVAAMRKRMLPIIGDGAGVWSFLHVEDAAAATIAAITRGAAGIYNVCDDEPAPARVWLPALAQAAGAPSPLRVPVWLGRLLAGEALVSMMTQMRGASNAKAKRELGWTPQYATWRVGFKAGLG